MMGRIRLVQPTAGHCDPFFPHWAEIALAAGFAVLEGPCPDTGSERADLALISGPPPASGPTGRHAYILDDGSPVPVLRARLGQVSGVAVLCRDPDRRMVLSAQGLPAQGIAPALNAWRLARPIRPAWHGARILAASDVSAGLLPGLASVPLPVPDVQGFLEYAPAVQAVVLQSADRSLFLCLAALATGLPLVLPPGALPWLGPLAAMRLPVDEAGSELMRLATEPATWFDQVQQGREALNRVARPSQLVDDLMPLLAP